MSKPTAPSGEQPAYVSIKRAQILLGDCSRSYIYGLIKRHLLRSANPGGRRRLIEVASVHALLRESTKP